jgi:hypothetical protein
MTGNFRTFVSGTRHLAAREKLFAATPQRSPQTTQEAALLPSYLGSPRAILANQGMYHYLHFKLVTMVPLLCVELSIEPLFFGKAPQSCVDSVMSGHSTVIVVISLVLHPLPYVIPR